jgi:lipopolysaccharide/colanic/teichoic acid biosynthesis glycosyltransferase
MNHEPTGTTVTLRATPSSLWLKDRVDFLLGAAGLVLAAPLLGLLAVMVRVDSPGPALFRQTRVGRGGRPFAMLKLRTMRSDVDPFGDSPQSGADPRITRLGRWLREWSLDELPQLLNVVAGDMSLVGPRPLYVQMVPEWTLRQRGRLLVKPGLTGLSQVNGRASLTIEERLEWDVRYVERFGLRTDLAILWTTLRRVVDQRGLYQTRYSAEREQRSRSEN